MRKRDAAIAALLILGVLPLWSWAIVPELTKLDKELTYKADLVSLDNFFDEAKGVFSGDTLSVSKFSYELVGKEGEHVNVVNSFEVRSIDGDPIFSEARTYTVDPYTGKIITDEAGRSEEYLFAPRHLQRGQSFTYRHINYDAPARMRFVGEETLHGLPVFVYETRYEGEHVDQTRNLTNLQDVGSSRGVEAAPLLHIWVEPLTGSIVKTHDQTTAYYNDLQTKARLSPWSRFSNVTSQESIRERVESAGKLKAGLLLIETVIPLLLVLSASGLVVLAFHSRLGILYLTVGALLVMTGTTLHLSPMAKEEVITIGILRWTPSPTLEQNLRGFKDALRLGGYEEGVNLAFRMPPVSQGDTILHEASAQSLKKDGVHLVFSQTTPGSLIAKEVLKNVPIVFSMVIYPLEVGLVDSLQSSGNNLTGTRNWISVEEQLGNFLALAQETKSIGFLYKATEPNSLIQLKDMEQSTSQRGLRLVKMPVNGMEEVHATLEANRKEMDALYAPCDTMIQDPEVVGVIIAFLQKEKLPNFTCNEDGVFRGQLMGTVAEAYRVGKLAGEKAVLILHGASPQSLETDTVSPSSLYINVKAAADLNLEIPQALLSRAKLLNQTP